MKTKQFLAALLSSAMVLGTMAVPVFAANAADASAFTTAVAKGGTVKLTGDVELTSTVNIEKDVTINLNGHKITATGARALHIKSHTVSITGTGTVSASGDIDSSSSVIRVGDSGDAAKLTIGSGVTVSTDKCYGVTVFGKNTNGIELVMNGTVNVTGPEGAISGNGLATNAATTMTIGGTVKSANKYAIYHPGAGTLTVRGNANISGPGAIEAKAGTVNINGGTIKATGTVGHTANSNGPSTSGYALAAVNNKAYKNGPATINVNGGNINGKVAIETDDDAEGNASISIKGGTFNTDPSEYVAGGYNKIETNNTWTVVNSYYTELQTLINGGGTVTLTKDYDLGTSYLTVPSGVDVTLNLDGHTISSAVDEGTQAASGNWTYDGVITNYGTLTIEGGSVNATHGTAVLNYGTLTIESGEFYSAEFAAFDNFGMATVKGGKFISDSASGVSPHYKYAFCNQAGTLTVDNAEVTGVHGCMGFNAGTVTVNDANVYTHQRNDKQGTNYRALYVAGERGIVKVTINGGSFTSGYNKMPALLTGNSNDGGYKLPAMVTINGGTFTGSDENKTALKHAKDLGEIVVNGGTFSSDVQSYVAVGKSVSKTENGYEVKAVNNNKLVEQIRMALQSDEDKEVYTAKSPVKDNGKYDQVSAAVLENGDTKAFHVTTSDNETGVDITVNDITEGTIMTGSVQIVCGLIITDIPTNKVVTVTVK